MTSATTVTLRIGNALPSANPSESASVIELWQSLAELTEEVTFRAQNGVSGEVHTYQVTLDASAVLQLMQSAVQSHGSFSAYLKAHDDDAALPLYADLAIHIAGNDHQVKEAESYQVATVFVQQLVMAVHIALPGAIQLLDTRFVGPGAHRYEAQEFDGRIFYGALKASLYNQWPKLKMHSLETVWRWLDACEVSQVDTAILGINKVLFTLLKIAQQRHEFSARTVMLVVYQLEVLLDCRESRSLQRLRERARLVLGDIPEAADSLRELHEVRNSLFVASQPVHRPPLISHGTADALKDQLGQHNTAVELGSALVMALLQDLIYHNARRYEFSESFTHG